jgi:site-specific DNA-cytosine methylase
MRTGHLFAGGGGGLYADLILGHTPVFAVEWDPWRVEWLRCQFPETEVIHADARTVDFAALAGRVDCLHAGIPCPAWSSARRGVGSPPDHTETVIRAVDQCRPEWVFLECVAGYKREHGRMRGLLRGIGYTLARPLILDAAGVGAPHSRARYWALGHSDRHGEPKLPIHAKVAVLPTPDPSAWESDPAEICLDDGLANAHKFLAAYGDGQVPLCAAVAWKLLGGP